MKSLAYLDMLLKEELTCFRRLLTLSQQEYLFSLAGKTAHALTFTKAKQPLVDRLKRLEMDRQETTVELAPILQQASRETLPIQAALGKLKKASEQLLSLSRKIVLLEKTQRIIVAR